MHNYVEKDFADVFNKLMLEIFPGISITKLVRAIEHS